MIKPEISTELMGKVVDEVFDGAIEDASVIEDIYRVIARELKLEPVAVKAQDDLVEALRGLIAAVGDWSRPTGANGMTSASPSHPLSMAATKGRAALAAHDTRSSLVAGDGEPDFGSLPILSLDTPTEPAAIRNAALEESFRAGLEAACEVIDAHSEYDRQLCCDGRECGCYGSTVHQSMQHYIRALQTAPASLDAEVSPQGSPL